FFFSSRRRHTRFSRDWSSDVCSSDLTTASGWLTDRFNSRWLLFCYYGLRGVSLLFLPFALASRHIWLTGFAVFYGLDWIATVPRSEERRVGKEGRVGGVQG